MRPLYNGCNPPNQAQADAHTGLWYDKFFDQYQDGKDWKVPDGGKLAWIKGVTGQAVGDPDMLKDYSRHQRELVKDLAGKTIWAQTDWHFATGLGNNHPVENGFAWHPTLGVPYLTGAAVKGLLRAWCEQWAGFEPDKLRLWFGPSWEELNPKKGSETPKQKLATGKLIFFDALPIDPVRLKADVMTPHMGDWYEKGDKEPDQKKPEGSNVPADWHSPVPTPFLVVDHGLSFQFSVAARPQSSIDVNDVIEELKKALTHLGAGAKTAAGYGRFSRFVDPSDATATHTPTKTTALPRFNIGDKVSVKRIEDPKGRGRVWFETEDGFSGVVTHGSVPQVEIGKQLELWIASVSNGYNFSAEPITHGTRSPQSQQKRR